MTGFNCTIEEAHVLAAAMADEDKERIQSVVLLTLSTDDKGKPFVTVSTEECDLCTIRILAHAISIVSAEGHANVD
jgi:hypothetical protein